MAAAKSFLLPITKLTGRENYGEWKEDMQAYLEHEELWNTIEADESGILNTDAKANLKAKSKIKLLISHVCHAHITTAKTTKEAWDSLKKAYEDEGLCNKISIMDSISSTNLIDCSFEEEYVSKIISYADKLRSFKMMNGLPHCFYAGFQKSMNQ